MHLTITARVLLDSISFDLVGFWRFPPPHGKGLLRIANCERKGNIRREVTRLQAGGNSRVEIEGLADDEKAESRSLDRP